MRINVAFYDSKGQNNIYFSLNNMKYKVDFLLYFEFLQINILVFKLLKNQNNKVFINFLLLPSAV